MRCIEKEVVVKIAHCERWESGSGNTVTSSVYFLCSCLIKLLSFVSAGVVLHLIRIH